MKNPTNKPPLPLLTQPLLQFKFNNHFRVSFYVKKSDLPHKDQTKQNPYSLIDIFFNRTRNIRKS